jgi:hypothetical protein
VAKQYKTKSLESEKGLDEEFQGKSQLAIEKIGNRINKDVRASHATFGIMQHLDQNTQTIGRLRRRAERLRDTTAYHAKRDLSSGDTYPLYPGIPPIGQRGVRQLRSHKPGIVPRPDKFA